MVFADPLDTALQAVIHSINATTPSWGLEPLSPKWVFFNGSIPSNTWVNGYFYDGTLKSINDTIIIQRKEIGDVGILPLYSFVYLMISFVVIIALLALPNCRYIVKLLLGGDKRFGTDSDNSTMSEYAFDRQLKEFYQPPGPEPLPSYPEAVDYLPSKGVSSSDIRDCQSMIRKIYALKVDAFNARDVRRANQDIVAGWKTQATGGLRDVQSIVQRWTQREDWSPEERVKINEIQQRMIAIQPDA